MTSGRRWPVVAGRPVLFPGMDSPEVITAGHEGNALSGRARQLIADATGRVLHLSGGGTVVGGDNVIDVDAAVFGPTDVVGDAHHLPFADETFDLVVAMNAFEHYADPPAVVARLHRLLKPGGLVFLHTAFLQPLHEAPHHYYNTTRFGLERWFAGVRDARPHRLRQLLARLHAVVAGLRGRGDPGRGRVGRGGARVPGHADGPVLRLLARSDAAHGRRRLGRVREGDAGQPRAHGCGLRVSRPASDSLSTPVAFSSMDGGADEHRRRAARLAARARGRRGCIGHGRTALPQAWRATSSCVAMRC